MNNIHSVVLAAGLSKRMGSINTNKVCFKLLDVPAVCRVIKALESAGIESHSVVIGACAAQVQECINLYCANRRISYAFQPLQRGTGDALACAVNALPAALPDDTLLLVIPGHRIVSPRVVTDLLEFYHRSNLKFAGVQLTDKQGKLIQQLSIFLGRLGDIKESLEQLYNRSGTDGEITLNDLALLMNKHRTDAFMNVDDFRDVMSFNDPAEFLLVTEILRQQQGMVQQQLYPGEYHLVRDWLQALNDHQSNLQTVLHTLYGGDHALGKRQHSRLINLMNKALENWGPESPVAVIRSPGRVNIMGRHIDHQGGNCNLMTIGYETLMVVRIRPDDLVTMTNLDVGFAPAQFSIGELVRDLPWEDWQTLIGVKKVARLLRYGVSWEDYIKAVFLRFQKYFCEQKLHGMDIIVGGNVPMAAGLSSSSALVVAAADMIVGANRLDLQPDKLVTLCSESEWFVGTRGGSADHAAVKLGECNKVVKVGFFNFHVEKLIDFPKDHALIVGDSHIKARKASNAKDTFNQRISCLHIGLMLLKKFYPEYAGRLQHLRDFNTRNLNIPLDWLYKLLLKLPEKATRSELNELLPEAELKQYWSNHAEPKDKFYNIRGVVIYALAECERARSFADALTGNIAQAGEMMNISHNGDRVQTYDVASGSFSDYFFDTSDAFLQKLIKDLQSSDPEKIERSQLWRIPGSYRCSLPEIDQMIDLALSVPGVAGAQLAGAGLGGCMMVLVKKESVDELTKVLTRKYYQPRELEPVLLHCRPIAGAGPIKWQ